MYTSSSASAFPFASSGMSRASRRSSVSAAANSLSSSVRVFGSNSVDVMPVRVDATLRLVYRSLGCAPVGSDHHGNRYGRSEQARAAVLHAADDLLVEHGFAGLTIEKIAAKAGVAKQTIYRWWPSKVDILLDAYGEDVAQELTPADLGSLAEDL